MQKKITLTKLGVILAVILIIPIGAYLLKFENEGISGQSSDWNNFSGFIGGILGPVLSIANILVVYYLALQVNAIEENRESKNQAEQQDRRLNDFRLNAYKEISLTIFDVLQTLTNIDNRKITPVMMMQFKFVLEGYSKLFSSLQNFDTKSMVTKLSTYESKGNSEQLAVIEELNNLIKGITSEIAFD